MRKYFWQAGLALLLAGLLAGANVFAASDPSNMLRGVADQMIASLKSKKATLSKNPSVVYSLAYNIIVPHADIPEMSKRVLPPQVWNGATPQQRQEFEKEFTWLLVRTYASALAEYTDETIRFYPVRGGYEGKSTIKVDSEIIRSDGPSIPVSYRLINKGSQWKLYDMVVEGVSLLESFRSQFSDKLSRGDMAELITELKRHNGKNS